MKIKETIQKYKKQRASVSFRTPSEIEDSIMETTSKDYMNDSLYFPSLIVGGQSDMA